MRNQFGGLFVILAQPRPIDSTSAEVLASIASLSKLQNLVWDFNGLSQNALGYRYAIPKIIPRYQLYTGQTDCRA
jgi:hypothetical protein